VRRLETVTMQRVPEKNMVCEIKVPFPRIERSLMQATAVIVAEQIPFDLGGLGRAKMGEKRNVR